MVKEYLKRNKGMVLISLLAVLVIKIIGDMSRTYRAFGGEDLLVVCTMLYWMGDYIDFSINHKNKKRLLKEEEI